ncbi:hypothetical protein D3C79_824110 [compost metagenome]
MLAQIGNAVVGRDHGGIGGAGEWRTTGRHVGTQEDDRPVSRIRWRHRAPRRRQGQQRPRPYRPLPPVAQHPRVHLATGFCPFPRRYPCQLLIKPSHFLTIIRLRPRRTVTHARRRQPRPQPAPGRGQPPLCTVRYFPVGLHHHYLPLALCLTRSALHDDAPGDAVIVVFVSCSVWCSFRCAWG